MSIIEKDNNFTIRFHVVLKKVTEESIPAFSIVVRGLMSHMGEGERHS